MDNSRFTSLLLVMLTLVLGAVPISAQQENDVGDIDPKEVFYYAYLNRTEGEKFVEEGKFQEAVTKYTQAEKYYMNLLEVYPGWKNATVTHALERTRTAKQAIAGKAHQEQENRKNNAFDLVEGGKARANDPAANQAGQAILPNAPAANNPAVQRPSVQQARQQDLAEIARLRNELKQTQDELAASRRVREDSTNKQLAAAEQARLNQQINQLTARVNQLNSQLMTARDLLTRAPLQSQLDELEQQNAIKEREIQMLAQETKRSREQIEAEKRNTQAFIREAEIARAEVLKVTQQMQQQQDINNKLVEALRNQLKTLSSTLEVVEKQLAQSNNRIAQLQESLNEMHDINNELKEENNMLMRERDLLRQTLASNNAESVQKLIEENIRLGTELREAEGRVEFLLQDGNAAKDELIRAKTDLSIAKTRIQDYQEKTAQQRVNFRRLENELAQTRAALEIAQENSPAGQDPEADEEVKILKATVSRLIAAQERRKASEKILWDAAQAGQIEGAGKEAIADLRKAQIALSEEERQLLDRRQADQNFHAVDRPNEFVRQRKLNQLERRVSSYNNMVRRAFENEHWNAARELLKESIDIYPGHFPSLCHLGTVEMRTKNYQAAREAFEEALMLRDDNSYAHFMLATCLYQMEDIEIARMSYEKVIDLEPDHAVAHLYLGNIAAQGARYKQAEAHWRNAIKYDVTLADPYFNLARLCSQQNRKNEGLGLYMKALENGALPDPALQRSLAQ